MKNDYRKKLTQQMFRSAFVSLLKEKPVQSITVRELCEKAEVNRGTFYSHYQDMYALLESVENEMFSELEKTLAQFTRTHEISFYEALLEFVKNNSDMCIVLIGKNSDRIFVDKLLSYGKEFFMRVNAGVISQENARYAEIFYEYASYGCLRLLQLWIDGGMKESVENTARLLEKLTAFDPNGGEL